MLLLFMLLWRVLCFTVTFYHVFVPNQFHLLPSALGIQHFKLHFIQCVSDWPLVFQLKLNRVVIASIWADSSFLLTDSFLCTIQRTYHILFVSYNTGGWTL